MLCTWALFLSLGLVAAAATDVDVAAVVDFSAKGAPLPHYWKRCVGSGHMLLGTRTDWRHHLTLAVQELGIQGIRGHGLLDDDMSVVPSKGQLEFYNVDQVFDFLMSVKVKPVVELSFTPKALVQCGGAGQKQCTYGFGNNGGYKGLIMPPDSFDDWYDLVRALAEHLVDRYGLQEVSSWHFEVWNEMWGVSYPEPYLSMYNASALALKAVHPSLRVGGPATMQTQDVGAFISDTRAKKLPVDFVSTHFYPSDPQCQTPQTKNDPDCFAHTVLAAKDLAKDAKLPFFITEYNNGLDTSRDDAGAAAFVFRHISLMQELDIFSWWTFSDVFEEGWMRSASFHNGYGMMTVQDIRKPVWRAFELLARAGDERLPVSGFVSPVDSQSDISVLATRHSNKDSGIQLFVANMHRLGDVTRYRCDAKANQCKKDPSGTYTDPVLCDANCRKGEIADSASLKLTNVTLTLLHSELLGDLLPTFVNGYRIDADHANPMKKWVHLGSPVYPTAAQIKAMDTASRISAEKVEVKRLNSTASSISFQMPPMAALQLDFNSATQELVV